MAADGRNNLLKLMINQEPADEVRVTVDADGIWLEVGGVPDEDDELEWGCFCTLTNEQARQLAAALTKAAGSR